jgi:hypothetical protein
MSLVLIYKHHVNYQYDYDKNNKCLLLPIQYSLVQKWGAVP